MMSNTPKPQVRHIAIYVRDTEKVAKFYQNVFDMEVVGVRGSGRSYYLSDGHLTLAILPHNTERSAPCGLNHFGFTVPDTEEISRRMVAEGQQEPTRRPADRAYAEFRGCDPEGNMFDLSATYEETRRPDLIHKVASVP